MGLEVTKIDQLIWSIVDTFGHILTKLLMGSIFDTLIYQINLVAKNKNRGVKIQ